MKACARFDEVLIAGYFLNGLSILEVKFVSYNDSLCKDSWNSYCGVYLK